MKSATLTLALGCTLCLAQLTVAKPPVAHAARPHANSQMSARAGVKRWVARFSRAFRARNPKAIIALYDRNVVAFDVTPPLSYVGKAAYLKDWETFCSEFTGRIGLEFRDTKIITSGDLAVIHTLMNTSGTMVNGQKSSMWLRVTAILRREHGTWLDIHDHVSLPTDMMTGKAVMDLQP